MNKLILITTLLCFFISMNTNAQKIYIDILTAPAMIINGKQLKEKQEQTNDNLNKIERAQLLVFTQMQKANELQNKIVKGLSEVSALLGDAYVVKDIYDDCSRAIEYGEKITKFVSQNPQYSIFALPAVNNISNRSKQLVAEVSQILLSGEKNMMNAGQRRELLRQVSIHTGLLASGAWDVLFSMENAKRVGFWNSLNPFNEWMNQDVALMRDIIRKSNYLGL